MGCPRGDMVCEKIIDDSTAEPSVIEVCNLLTDYILHDRIKKDGDTFDKDRMDAMTQDEVAIANLSTAADKNKANK